MNQAIHLIEFITKICLDVLSAEQVLGKGKGKDKLAFVMERAQTRLDRSPLTVPDGNPTIMEVVTMIETLVSTVVALLNLFGVFKSKVGEGEPS